MTWIKLPIEAIGPFGLDTCNKNLRIIYSSDNEYIAFTQDFVNELSICNTAPYGLNHFVKRIRLKLMVANAAFREAKLRYREHLEELQLLLAAKATWEREKPVGDGSKWRTDGKRLLSYQLTKKTEIDNTKNGVAHATRESRKVEEFCDFAQKRFVEDVLEQTEREICIRIKIITTPPPLLKGLKVLRSRAINLRQTLERHPKMRDVEADTRHEAQDVELNDLWLNYNKWTMNGATRRTVRKRALKSTQKLADDKERECIDKIKVGDKEGRANEPSTEALRREVPVIAAMVPQAIPSKFDLQRHATKPPKSVVAKEGQVGAIPSTWDSKKKQEVESGERANSREINSI